MKITELSEQLIAKLKKSADDFVADNYVGATKLDRLIVENAFLSAAAITLVEVMRDEQ